jgi:deazaflavin-dependent oxidoreductase (nitroreductase family)
VKQATYTKCVRPAAAAMARMHIAVHRATRGRVGRRWRGGQVALLSTVGRRTRRRRTTPLVCLRDGCNIVVVASNGGSDRPPEWWLNLQHHPYAEVEIEGRSRPVIAEPALADTYLRLSQRFADAFPCFNVYRSRTRRVLPVIVLRPAPAEGRPGFLGG